MQENILDIIKKDVYNINDLVKIMTILRSEKGCPWDREQNHESIRNNFIEETYEVVEAIDNNDSALLLEELGDVLLQVIFHSRLAEEEGKFNFEDVVNDICVKLIFRHPHIFGETKADTSEQVLKNWDAIKRNAKNQTTVSSELDSVAKSLPALLRAGKLIKKAKKAGIDVNDNIKNDVVYDIGARLFSVASEAVSDDIDPEQALYNYCEKFIENLDK